jgi:hypothetical protein
MEWAKQQKVHVEQVILVDAKQSNCMVGMLLGCSV